MTKENCSIQKPRFFMDITYKQNHKVNQINRGTIYFKIYHQNLRGLSHLHPELPHVLCLRENHF